MIYPNKSKPTGDPSQNVKTLYIGDSTASSVDIYRMIPGKVGNRETAFGLDTVIRKLKNTNPSYKKIIIQSGINDIRRYANSVVKKKITKVFETAKNYLPQSEIFMTSIIGRESSTALLDINDFIKAQSMKFKYKYVNTSHLIGKAEMYRDPLHPNNAGVGQIVKQIKEAIGLHKTNRSGYFENHNTGYNSYSYSPHMQWRYPRSAGYNNQAFHQPW